MTIAETADFFTSLARDTDNIEDIVEIVNVAYSNGEKGMWKDPKAKRTDEIEVKNFIHDKKIIVGRLRSDHRVIVGCIYCDTTFSKSVGELGMLSVSQSFTLRGIGSLLIRSAEEHCRKNGCASIRLEILQPKDIDHPFKKFLHGWYTKLGYVKTKTETWGVFTKMFPKIVKLLAVACNFNVYMKKL